MTSLHSYTKTEKRQRHYPLLRFENVIIEETEHDGGIASQVANICFLAKQTGIITGNLALLPLSFLSDFHCRYYNKTGNNIEESAKAVLRLIEGRERTKERDRIRNFMRKQIDFEKRKSEFNRQARIKRWKNQWVSFTPQEIEEAKMEEEFVFV